MDSAIINSFSGNNEKNNNVGLSGQNEFEKLWKTVQDNPSDFNAFSQLVALAEKDGDIEKIRKAYEAFLDEYPLCYAFWKKYAEHEAAKKEFTKAKAIYQQALSDKGIPYSVDMWTCYCSFLIDTPAARENLEEIRRFFHLFRTLFLNHSSASPPFPFPLPLFFVLPSFLVNTLLRLLLKGGKQHILCFPATNGLPSCTPLLFQKKIK